MTASHIVIFGLADQDLRHVTPQRVTAATFEILDTKKAQTDPGRILSEGSASVPAWALILDDDAGPSQPNGSRIPVASTVGPNIGEVVAIASTDGSFEEVTVGAIEAGDYIEVTSVLARSYVPGATVESATISAPVPIGLYDFEDALDDQRPLHVEWTYAVGGVTKVVVEPIRLSRQTQAAVSVGAALELARKRFPDMGVSLHAQSLEQLASWSLAHVELELLQRREDPASLMLGLQGAMLLAARLFYDAALGGYSPGMRELPDFIEDMNKEYTTQLEATVVGQAGTETIKLNTESVANKRPDQTYRSPLGPM